MYRIVDELNGQICVHKVAATEKSALKKFRNSLLTADIYEIITGEDGKPRLVSSYGGSFRADAV